MTPRQAHALRTDVAVLVAATESREVGEVARLVLAGYRPQRIASIYGLPALRAAVFAIARALAA